MTQCYWTGLWAEIKEMKKSSRSYSSRSPSLIIDHTPEGMTLWLSAPASSQPSNFAVILNNITMEEIKAVTERGRGVVAGGESYKGSARLNSTDWQLECWEENQQWLWVDVGGVPLTVPFLTVFTTVQN